MVNFCANLASHNKVNSMIILSGWGGRLLVTTLPPSRLHWGDTAGGRLLSALCVGTDPGPLPHQHSLRWPGAHVGRMLLWGSTIPMGRNLDTCGGHVLHLWMQGRLCWSLKARSHWEIAKANTKLSFVFCVTRSMWIVFYLEINQYPIWATFLSQSQ